MQRQCLQALLMHTCDWATSLTYAASTKVGDFGTLYVSDGSGAIYKATPTIVSGPKVWKPDSSVEWKLTGTVAQRGRQLSLAFRYVFMVFPSSAVSLSSGLQHL